MCAIGMYANGTLPLTNVDNDRNANWLFHGSVGNENVQSIRKWQPYPTCIKKLFVRVAWNLQKFLHLKRNKYLFCRHIYTYILRDLLLVTHERQQGGFTLCYSLGADVFMRALAVCSCAVHCFQLCVCVPITRSFLFWPDFPAGNFILRLSAEDVQVYTRVRIFRIFGWVLVDAGGSGLLRRWRVGSLRHPPYISAYYFSSSSFIFPTFKWPFCAKQ